ncbi:MAG: hypothetical protein OHK0031_13070 [Anaerolineales bacterium]
MKTALNFLLRALLLLALIFPARPAAAQGVDPAARAQQLLTRLSPEERVGQLFLVTFQGNDTSSASTIYDLIVNHHVGGVALSAANDNFHADPDVVSAASALIHALQQAEWQATLQPASVETPHAYIPLLIGLSQEGGGFPNDQILSGLTPLPDQMTIGATWNTDLAEQAGQVMGRELAAIGVNFYLGLSLDVLSSPNPAISADLGTRVFGGDPYWVSQMGSAYLRGLHSGSNQRLAVIAKHFPGRGGADRPPEQEISTVRRSLEELKQVELAPFFAVTGNAASSEAAADGLLASHIRYQGFQGNIRATTRPVSFDQQALGLVLGLPEISAWRQNGGLLVSDNLGTTAVRRFYDPGGQSFSARLVARDAFLAGNDILYTGNLLSSDAPDVYTSLLRTLDYFTQKYNEDPAFAGRVDESVLRILTLKYRLYPSFSLENVTPPAPQPGQIGGGKDVVFSIVRQSATLISPQPAELANVLPDPPASSDYIVFITDTRKVQQCVTCPSEDLLGVDAFQKAVVNLYGPSSGGLILTSHLSSYSFDDLALLLDDKLPGPEMTDNLRRATWIVLSSLDLNETRPQAQTLRRFLSEKQNLLLNRRVLLFSFSAPYYLDATDIANLTAYYGMYSKSAPFVEFAARLLFQEVSAVGAPPISIPGTGYDLITATSPNPAQVISLALDLPASALLNEKNLEPTPAPIYRVGDSIAVRTGVITDHNNRPVPDGTVVRFIFSQDESGLLVQPVETVTSQGIARATFRLTEPGALQIHVTSEPATVSDVLQLDVSAEGASVIIITPTPVQTEAEPSATPAISPTPTLPANPLTNSGGYPNIGGWLLLTLLLFSGAILLAWLTAQFIEPRWAIRLGLTAFLGGVIAYNYLILDFPGSAAWLNGRGLLAFVQAILIGHALGALTGWLWRQRSR